MTAALRAITIRLPYAFYETAKERNAAFDRGVTADLMDHGRYVAEVSPFLLSDRCPHKVVASA